MTAETPQIRFDDGSAYERFMGGWSRAAGTLFLDWLDAPRGGRWCDVGCGNGAFTELLVERLAPARIDGIDPSPEQIDYARRRIASPAVGWQVGDAMALPYADASFDAAAMALVIFFVPDPARGVAEMARVVRPGGLVAAYAWDIRGGGFPYAALQEEMAAIGQPSLEPPSAEASRLESLRALWGGAGLVDIETHAVEVARTFEDIEAFWSVARTGPRLAPKLETMPAELSDALKHRVAQRLGDGSGRRIRCTARANAVRGRAPG